MNLSEVRCEECGVILRELMESGRLDTKEMRARFYDVAQSSGRDPEEFRKVWLSSMMNMPDHEFRTLHRARSRRFFEARRKQMEHETLTGHAVLANGWQAFQR